MRPLAKWTMPLLAAVMALLPGSGCDCKDYPNCGDPSSYCCKYYGVGRNMLAQDMIPDDSESNSIVLTYFQSCADLAAKSGALLLKVRSGCHALAKEMGAEDLPPMIDPAEDTRAWCSLAADKLLTGLAEKGTLKVLAQPARCVISVPDQVQCELGCGMDAACVDKLSRLEARCEPSSLVGTCTGECTGTCHGSSETPVHCEGSCEGLCQGTCDGDTDSGPLCQGTCKGSCWGSCTPLQEAMACEGECQGSCSTVWKGLACATPLRELTSDCTGEATCMESCRVMTEAKAHCEEPVVVVTLAGNSTAETRRGVTSLRRHLPAILSAYATEWRLGSAASRQANASYLVLTTERMTMQSAACILPAVGSAADAGKQATAAVDGAKSVVVAVGLEALRK